MLSLEISVLQTVAESGYIMPDFATKVKALQIIANYCKYKGKTNSFHPALLDVGTGKEKRFEGEGHAYPIECVAFSPDARYAVSGSRDFTLKLWDVKTGKEIRQCDCGCLFS